MDKDNWKWWYYVVAGVLIAAYGVYEFSTWQIGKGIGSELLAALCIAIGLFSRRSAAASAKSSEREESELPK